MSDAQVAEKLSERGYWDSVHEREKAGRTQSDHISRRRRFKTAVKHRLGPRFAESLSNYDDYLLWEVILPKYLANRAGQPVVEIGSAPGDFLVRLSRRFDLDPYGIEYSPVGAELNRAAFTAAGLDPGHVTEGDVFAREIRERYAGAFDVVLSRGFIEHFTDPARAIDAHLDLLRPGGLLIVSIPNLRGLNFLLSWIFDRKVLAMHNLAVMTRDRFATLFALERLEPLQCEYYGTFSFCLFNSRPEAPLRSLLVACWSSQPFLNAFFRLVLGPRSLESPWSSPNLIFIGLKR